jgi:hypothetical protein
MLASHQQISGKLLETLNTLPRRILYKYLLNNNGLCWRTYYKTSTNPFYKHSTSTRRTMEVMDHASNTRRTTEVMDHAGEPSTSTWRTAGNTAMNHAGESSTSTLQTTEVMNYADGLSTGTWRTTEVMQGNLL